MSYLKSLGAAFLAFLAIFAASRASRHQGRAEGLKKASEGLSGPARDKAINEVIRSQARAHELTRKSLDRINRIGENDPNLDDMLHRWRSKRLRD